MSDRLKIVEHREVKPFVYPERWEEFVRLLCSGITAEEVDRMRIINRVADCIADAFGVPVEVLKSTKGSADYSDSRVVYTYLLLQVGVTEAWLASYFNVSKGTISYRKGRFCDLYDTDSFFNRRVNSAILAMHGAGLFFIRVS